MGIDGVGRLLEGIKTILKPERLDELSEPAPEPGRAPFVATLVRSEELPFDHPAPQGRPSAFTGIFASEDLPFDERPEPLNRRPSFITTLFSRESLPTDPGAGGGRGGRGTGA